VRQARLAKSSPARQEAARTPKTPRPKSIKIEGNLTKSNQHRRKPPKQGTLSQQSKYEFSFLRSKTPKNLPIIQVISLKKN